MVKTKTSKTSTQKKVDTQLFGNFKMETFKVTNKKYMYKIKITRRFSGKVIKTLYPKTEAARYESVNSWLEKNF